MIDQLTARISYLSHKIIHPDNTDLIANFTLEYYNHDPQLHKRNPSRPINLCSSGFQYVQSACRYFTSRSNFISRCQRVASGDSPRSETLNGNCRPEEIWVDSGGISLVDTPWHIASALLISTKSLSSRSPRRPWATERKQSR